MRCSTNGVTVEETADGAPYKLWRADEYTCPSCGCVAAMGFGSGPIAEHWRQPEYNNLKADAVASEKYRRGD
jgi:hypothetical protein